MTAKQFYSEEGQLLQSLIDKKKAHLNRVGYYSKYSEKLADKIQKLTEKIERLYP